MYKGPQEENGITKRQHLAQTMKDEKLDVLLLTEAQVNTSSVETHGDFLFFFSSDVQPGKADREHAGVGIVIQRKFKPYIYEIEQGSGRLMCIRLRSQGTNICFVCCYAPHSGHLSEIKETFYDNSQNLLDEIQQATFIGGDFNAWIHHRYMTESVMFWVQASLGGVVNI